MTQPVPLREPVTRGALDFDTVWAVCAVFGTLVCLVGAALFAMVRKGLPGPPDLLPGSVLVFAAVLLGPMALRFATRIPDRARATLYPLCSLAILASPAVALWSGSTLATLYPALAIAGLAGAASSLRRIRLREWALLTVMAVATGLYLFVTVNNLGYAGVYTPEQAVLGLLNHDTRFHSAIAFLIQNFGVPSLGVDGAVPIKYHFGSHVWVAGMGRLWGSEPLWTYGATVPVVLVPMLLSSLIHAGISLDRARKPPVAYIALGILMLFIADNVGWNSYYVSESYTLAIIAMMLALPALASFSDRKDGLTQWSALGVALALVPVLMACKVSVGILWCAAVGWAALRRYGLGWAGILASIATCACFLTGLHFFAPGTSDYVHTNGSMFAPLYILRMFPELDAPFGSFVLPAALFLLVIHKGEGLRNLLATRGDVPLELVVLVTAVGALPAFLGIPQDSATWYFLNVGQWFAMPMLVARLAPDDFRIPEVLRQQRAFRPMLLVFSFLALSQLVQSMTPTFQKFYREIINEADRQHGGRLLNGQPVAAYLKDSLKTSWGMFDSRFVEALNASAGKRLVDQVRAVTAKDAGVGVFVPPANRDFWAMQKECRDKHHLQASLTGLPSLYGSPPSEFGCGRDAYDTGYGGKTDSRDMPNAALCLHALERGISKVVVVASLDAHSVAEVLDCRSFPK